MVIADPTVRVILGILVVVPLIVCTLLYFRSMRKIGRNSIFYTVNDLPGILASKEFYIISLIIIATVIAVFSVLLLGGNI